MRRALFGCLPVIALLLMSSGSARAADAAQACRSGTPDSRIAGCTALLAQARTARQHAIALDGRCWARNDRQSYADAIPDCTSAVRADGEYPYAYHNRGIAQAGLGQHAAAIADFSRVLALRPNFAYTYLNRAKSYAALGDTRAAVRDYDEVLRLKPDNEEARAARAALIGLAPPAAPVAPAAASGTSLCGATGCY